MIERQDASHINEPEQTLIDTISEKVRKEYPGFKSAVDKNPKDAEARRNLKSNAELAGRVLEELLNKSEEEQKQRNAEIDEIHGILGHWEKWRQVNPDRT